MSEWSCPTQLRIGSVRGSAYLQGGKSLLMLHPMFGAENRDRDSRLNSPLAFPQLKMSHYAARWGRRDRTRSAADDVVAVEVGPNVSGRQHGKQPKGNLHSWHDMSD